MYVLYIDESGVPELSAKSPYCILGGVLMREEDEKAFSFLVQSVKKKYKLDLDKHIHSVDIFENKTERCFLGNTSRRTKKDLRKHFQKDIWDIIKNYAVNYYAVTVPKDKVREILKLNRQHDNGKSWIKSSNFFARIDRQLPMDIGINKIYNWAMKNIGKEDKLKIVLEARSSGDMFTIRNYGIIQEVGAFKYPAMIAFSKEFKKRVVSIAFANIANQS